MRPRFSLSRLLAVVAFFGVGFAALHSPSLLWASGVFSVAVLLFSVATVGAFASRGTSRPSFIGFATLGWAYILATFWLWPAANGVTAPPFLSNFALDYFSPSPSNASFMVYDPGGRSEYPEPFLPVAVKGTPFTGRMFNLHHYRRIGHSLTAIALGIIGALIGRLFAASSEACP